jgi:tripartite-type tricarboxylate transporter receptor subunit TctC
VKTNSDASNPATDSCPPGLSSRSRKDDLALLCTPTCITQGFENIFTFQVPVLSHKLIDRQISTDLCYDHSNRNPHSAMHGLPPMTAGFCVIRVNSLMTIFLRRNIPAYRVARCGIAVVAAWFALSTVTSEALAQTQSQSRAQSWPTKPLRAFIPFGAGSATDLIPRAVFDALAGELGQPIVVENHGGAGGTIAGNAVVRAEPDGHTMLATSMALSIAQWIVPNMPYDTAKELAGALMLGQNSDVLIAPPQRGWKTVGDLVAAAKAKPGSINYGSAGVGTGTHLNAEKFRLAAGIEAVHIPYKGGAEALADIISGRIDFYFCPISTALPFIADGRVTALAISTPARAPDLPDVPTTVEAGYPGSAVTVWYGVFMPARTPRAIIDKFHEAGVRVLAMPATRQRLRQLAVDPMPMTPAEMDRFLAEEIAANGRLIKAAGIK